MTNKSVLSNMKKEKLLHLKLFVPKDKSLITALEPKFAEIEKLQNYIKQTETLYKQYIDELATAAIKKPTTPTTESTTSLETIEQPIVEKETKKTIEKKIVGSKENKNDESIKDSKPVKPKIAIIKKKSPKAKTTFNDILEASE